VYEAHGLVALPPPPPLLVDESMFVGASVMSPELHAPSAAVSPTMVKFLKLFIASSYGRLMSGAPEALFVLGAAIDAEPDVLDGAPQ
jgi:hypothetical protein